MKVLLRAVLFFDALFDLMLGIVLLVAPFATLYAALQLPQPQPPLYGQLLGVGLVGFAALLARAAFHGALTVPVARVVGWVNLVSAVLIGAWLLFFELPVQGAGRIWLPLMAVMLAFFAVLELPLAGRILRREREERLREALQADAAARGSTATGAAPATTDPVYAEPYVNADRASRRAMHEQAGETPAERRGARRSATETLNSESPEIRREPGITPPPGYGPGTEVPPDEPRADTSSPHHARQNPYS